MLVSKVKWLKADSSFDQSHRGGFETNIRNMTTMTVMVEPNLYELHVMDERVFHDFIKQK